MGIGQKEWLCKYKDHTIRVVNTWFGGAKLYIGGDCKDICKDFFAVSGKAPLLSGSLPDTGGDKPDIVEVYMVSFLTTRTKICVNGEQVGGDVF